MMQLHGGGSKGAALGVVLLASAANLNLWAQTNSPAPQGTSVDVQVHEAEPVNRAARVKALLVQLAWHNALEAERYDARKGALTEVLLKEIDGYISDTFAPASSHSDQVKDGLDALLGVKKSDEIHNVAFMTNLSDRRYLIIGVELVRGSTAINADAMSFRAYVDSGAKFKYVAEENELGESAGVDLNARALPNQPLEREFWFLAWAEKPPLAPYTDVLRIYAFDGRQFRRVWAPPNIISENTDHAVQITPDGQFIVNEMPDFRSQEIVHEQYYINSDGPQKVNEWSSGRN